MTSVTITLAHDSPEESRIREQLQHLLQRYDLTPWQFTDRVIVDQDAIPHSHPVLTLHARHQNDDALLLSTYIHEQLHWFLSAQPDDRVASALASLEERYPNVPVGYPAGAGSVCSSYLHYIVCYLEYAVVRELIGDSEAARIMHFWQHDHYTEIYATVMQDMPVIQAIVQREGLVPLEAMVSDR